MITGVAFVPSTPLLVPAVGVGASHELDHLRAGCMAALAEVLSPATQRVVVVGAGAKNRLYTEGSGTLRGFGVDLDVDLSFALNVPGEPPLPQAPGGGERLPLALTLGTWLLQQAGWSGERLAVEIDMSADEAEVDSRALEVAHLLESDLPTALLVVADGSAARTEKAPASLHPEAAGFDAAVAAALASGLPANLGALDRERAIEVSAGGWPAWHLASSLCAGAEFQARMHADEAPYGVGYLVAEWVVR